MSELPDYVCKLEADNERLYNETITLKQQRDALLDACKAFKLRIAYIGLPSEPMSGPNVPDWKNEIAMLEAAIALAEKEE